jgi:hypothetical protein
MQDDKRKQIASPLPDLKRQSRSIRKSPDRLITEMTERAPKLTSPVFQWFSGSVRIPDHVAQICCIPERNVQIQRGTVQRKITKCTCPDARAGSSASVTSNVTSPYAHHAAALVSAIRAQDGLGDRRHTSSPLGDGTCPAPQPRAGPCASSPCRSAAMSSVAAAQAARSRLPARAAHP